MTISESANFYTEDGLQGILYNITVKVDEEFASLWLSWALLEYGPGIIATSCFVRFAIWKLLSIDSTDGPTYAIQFYGNSMTDYHRYEHEFASHFRTSAFNKWGEKMMAFESVLEAVN